VNFLILERGDVHILVKYYLWKITFTIILLIVATYWALSDYESFLLAESLNIIMQEMKSRYVTC